MLKRVSVLMGAAMLLTGCLRPMPRIFSAATVEAIESSLHVGLVKTLAWLASPARPRGFIFQSGHLGGTYPELAQPYIDQLMRYSERALDWPVGSARGGFVAQEPDSIRFIDAQKPAFGIFDLEVFLDLRVKYDLQPLATIGRGEVLHVIVKQPGLAKLEDLKGKTILSDRVDNPRYLSRVAFYQERRDFERDFKLARTASPLKGLKWVRDGRADATLVGDEAFSHLKDLDQALHSIADSRRLPPAVLVSFGPRPDAERFTAMFQRMVGDPTARELCRAMGIEEITKADRNTYEEAIGSYEE